MYSRRSTLSSCAEPQRAKRVRRSGRDPFPARTTKGSARSLLVKVALSALAYIDGHRYII